MNYLDIIKRPFIKNVWVLVSHKDGNVPDVLCVCENKENIRQRFKKELWELWPAHSGDMDKHYRSFNDCVSDMECIHDSFNLRVVKKSIE